MAQTFERIANDLHPKLHRCAGAPQRIVEFGKASPSFFGVKACAVDHDINDLSWGKGSDFILDFGIHMVGYLSFHLDYVGQNMDAPCRLRLTFGESPLDVTMDMNNVKTWISTAWLPDEVINIDICPQTISLPRRYSFRYLRVQIIDTSPKFKVSFSNVQCESVSAVSQDHQIDAVEFPDPLLQDIDHVCISTLRDCMQTVFEDGPRRDRRLWIGDLRLQALANYSTFRDLDLVKRCLFQFAAVRREDGSLPACIFEKPTLTASTDYIADYDALFAAIVYDYVEASGDMETGLLLWETVLDCPKRLLSNLNSTSYVFEAERSKHHIFLDWAKGLDKSAGAHGVLLYCLKVTNKLAVRLNKQPPYNELILKMTEAANSFLKDGIFVSGQAQQVSYASAAWLVLCGAFPPEIARKAFLATISHPNTVKPLTPYLWHHVCDALAMLGCYDECVDLIKSYWGGMVEAGADTFWECYDAQDCMTSPYGDDDAAGYGQGERRGEADSLVNLTATPQSIPAPEGHLERFSEGLDRILTWNVFPQEIDPIPVDDGSLMAMPDELPPISFPELKRLQKCYLSTVHSVNPILDVAVLDQYVTKVSENGLDWTTQTCLVALVVAHSEIRYEIPSLPGSMLEHIEDRLTFPSPPAANCLFDETIAWYYFLADIAARHLINRIVDAKVEISGCPSEVQARSLLRSYEVFGSQLQDWYLSLPPEISFPPPDATISPESNIYKRILRSRYLFIKELLCRPFVRLCLNYDLELPSALDDEIVSIASLGLQYCAWRLKAVDRMNKLDHGLWIWIRNSTACSMILIGAARSLQFHSVTASKRLVLPQDWREIVVSFLHGLEKYSHETRGGVAACYRLVTWGLDGFQPSSPDII
ncbi:Alpha-L-rhamnosidase, six-hairpin glycosidase domain [Fusarium oxysporum f. sp. vasinfectum]|nr:Alpha-L-rhamnosidase, six-hairpin glycosidase domain [Fusarium oxysporum f. sp. vasinfectum]KAK2925440.1 Alpha-L-rhamnosidase, six-hairpin glycosidase domain [Fusarium oxysporum f. sp. vasinfectum]